MATLEELSNQIDVASWDWLRPHAGSGALVMIDAMLDLAEVGFAMSVDDAEKVKRWMAGGLLHKPSKEQSDLFEQTPQSQFKILVISPFVLVQPEK